MSHTAVENARRARAGVFVLESYRSFKQALGEDYANEPAADLLRDVLTDLRHAADAMEVDFADAALDSLENYAAEVEDTRDENNNVDPRGHLPHLPAFPPAGSVTVEAESTDEGYLHQPVGAAEISAALQPLGAEPDTYQFPDSPTFTELGLYNVRVRAQNQDYLLKLWVVPTIKEGQ